MIRDLRKNDNNTTGPVQPLTMNLKIAKDPNSPFFLQKTMIDTGMTVAAIGLPKELCDQLGIVPVGSTDAVVASGDQSTYQIGEVSIIIGDQGLVVNCLIGSVAPMIGLPLINLGQLVVEGGKVQMFRLNDKNLKSIKPYSD